jgi:hypothetical protein
LADPVPDANTIWTFSEALTRAPLSGRPAIEVLFGAYDHCATVTSLATCGRTDLPFGRRSQGTNHK